MLANNVLPKKLPNSGPFPHWRHLCYMVCFSFQRCQKVARLILWVGCKQAELQNFILSWCIVTLQETSECMGLQIFPICLWEESQKERKQWQQSKQSSRCQFWKRNKSKHYQSWWKRRKGSSKLIQEEAMKEVKTKRKSYKNTKTLKDKNGEENKIMY